MVACDWCTVWIGHNSAQGEPLGLLLSLSLDYECVGKIRAAPTFAYSEKIRLVYSLSKVFCALLMAIHHTECFHTVVAPSMYAFSRTTDEVVDKSKGFLLCYIPWSG